MILRDFLTNETKILRKHALLWNMHTNICWLFFKLGDGPGAHTSTLVDQMTGRGRFAGIHVADDHNFKVLLLMAAKTTHFIYASSGVYLYLMFSSLEI